MIRGLVDQMGLSQWVSEHRTALVLSLLSIAASAAIGFLYYTESEQNRVAADIEREIKSVEEDRKFYADNRDRFVATLHEVESPGENEYSYNVYRFRPSNDELVEIDHDGAVYRKLLAFMDFGDERFREWVVTRNQVLVQKIQDQMSDYPLEPTISQAIHKVLRDANIEQSINDTTYIYHLLDRFSQIEGLGYRGPTSSLNRHTFGSFYLCGDAYRVISSDPVILVRCRETPVEFARVWQSVDLHCITIEWLDSNRNSLGWGRYHSQEEALPTDMVQMDELSPGCVWFRTVLDGQWEAQWVWWV